MQHLLTSKCYVSTYEPSAPVALASTGAPASPWNFRPDSAQKQGVEDFHCLDRALMTGSLFIPSDPTAQSPRLFDFHFVLTSYHTHSMLLFTSCDACATPGGRDRFIGLTCMTNDLTCQSVSPGELRWPGWATNCFHLPTLLAGRCPHQVQALSFPSSLCSLRFYTTEPIHYVLRAFTLCFLLGLQRCLLLTPPLHYHT